MAKIKVESQASGTGVYTLKSGTSNTDYTITLPDATGILSTIANIVDTAEGVKITGTGLDDNVVIEVSGDDDNIAPDLVLKRLSNSPADNDNLGGLEWVGNHSGGGENSYAQITCIAEDVTDGTEDGALRFYTATNGSTTEKLRITGDGNVGIGTTSPDDLLNLESSVPILRFTDSDDATYSRIYHSGGTLVLDADKGETGANSQLIMTVDGTTRLSLTSDGRGLSQFTAKAWAEVNQTGTQAINDSHGISSITDTGTGKTKFTFTSSLGYTNYSVFQASNYDAGGWYAEKLATSVDWVSYVGSYIDISQVSILVFGD